MLTPALLEFAEDGTPCSSLFGDVYHSADGGLEQARHVFITGNFLPGRWQQKEAFTILETGFGTGLNFLATWQAWQQDPQRPAHLHFISCELHPFSSSDMRMLHRAYPELQTLSEALRENWPPLTAGFHRLLLDEGRVTLTLLFGDAKDTLPALSAQADAIYLDGFAPQKNPQLWSAEFLALVCAHAAPDATLASWCVAGNVRSALSELGWTLNKEPGFGKKRHMLQGQRCVGNPLPQRHSKHAIVIGAGIAGCSAAEALARRGWRITLIERHPAAAQEASGNPLGLVLPMLALDDNLAARFSRAAYFYTLRKLKNILARDGDFPAQLCGVLHIARNDEDAQQQRETLLRHTFPEDYVRWLNQAEASHEAGVTTRAGGWYFPQAAWVSPADFCNALLREAGANLDAHFGITIDSIAYRDQKWHVMDEQGALIASAPTLILANAQAASRLPTGIELGLHGIRGQISYVPEATLDGLKTGLCGAAYAIHVPGRASLIGASFIEHDSDTQLRAEEHSDNLARLAGLLRNPFPIPADINGMDGRVSFRAASADRMPLVGQLPAAETKVSHQLSNLPRQCGLFCLLGLGARGLSWAPLAAELLASQICHDTLPLEKVLVNMLDPARFQLRHVRKQ